MASECNEWSISRLLQKNVHFFCGVMLLLFLCRSEVQAQNTELDLENIEMELSAREITTEEFYNALLVRGINPSNVNFRDTVQLKSLRPIFDEIFQELSPIEVLEAELDDEGRDVPLREEDDSEPDLEEYELDSPRIYGRELFRSDRIVPIWEPTGNSPNDSYVLGPGDKLAISVWGASRMEKVAQIDAEGFLVIRRPDLRIYLKDVRLSQARDLLYSRLRSVLQFNEDEIIVSLAAARIIKVNLLGELEKVGSIDLPATNTALQAIAAGGGPTEIGSMRQIKIVSGGKTRILDLYEILENPEGLEDFYLQDNAIILVPIIESRVEVSGAVYREAMFDVKPGESLKDALRYAGGLQPSAYKSKISVERFLADRVQSLDVNIENASDFILAHGDIIRVLEIPGTADNLIKITGAVYKEGEYQLEPNSTLSLLLAKANLLETARTDLAYIQREKTDGSFSFIPFIPLDVMNKPSLDLELKAKDLVIILKQQDYVDSVYVASDGALRRPGRFPYEIEGNLKVSDIIQLSGGLKPSADSYAFVIRSNPSDLDRVNYIPIDLAAFKSGDFSSDITLNGGDSLYVYDRSESLDETYVMVTGEVNRPDTFIYDRLLTVKNLILLSAGFTKRAARNRIDIYRLDINENVPTKTIARTLVLDDNLEVKNGDGFYLQPFDQVVVRSLPNYKLQRMVEISGEVKYPGPYAILSDNQKISELIEMAGGLTEEAFVPGASLYRKEDNVGAVVMQLDEALKNPKSAFNYILKEGDAVSIPKKQELVEISGAINARLEYPERFLNEGNSIKVPFHASKNALYYIENYAAGVAKNGDKKLITVEHPNGQIESTRKFLFIKNYPEVRRGSKIRVGYKPPETIKQKEKKQVNWGQVLAETLALLTGVLTVVVLAQRVN